MFKTIENSKVIQGNLLILVVFGHTPQSDLVTNLIYSFHMMGLMLISVTKIRTDISYWKSTGEVVRKYALPFLIWMFIYVVVSARGFDLELYLKNISFLYTNVNDQIASHLWYYLFLFWSILFINTFKFLKNRPLFISFALILCLSTWVIDQRYFMFGIWTLKYTLIFLIVYVICLRHVKITKYMLTQQFNIIIHIVFFILVMTHLGSRNDYLTMQFGQTLSSCVMFCVMYVMFLRGRSLFLFENRVQRIFSKYAAFIYPGHILIISLWNKIFNYFDPGLKTYTGVIAVFSIFCICTLWNRMSLIK